MPIPQEQLKRVDEAVDNWLKRTDPKQFNEGAPRNSFGDSPPGKIHGDQVASPWGEKPKVPIPIEHI
jgi:hypothetical protein